MTRCPASRPDPEEDADPPHAPMLGVHPPRARITLALGTCDLNNVGGLERSCVVSCPRKSAVGRANFATEVVVPHRGVPAVGLRRGSEVLRAIDAHRGVHRERDNYSLNYGNYSPKSLLSCPVTAPTGALLSRRCHNSTQAGRCM